MRIFVDLNHREKDQQRNQSKNKRNSVRPDDAELLTSIYFRLIRDGLFSFYSLHNSFFELNFMCIACFQVILNKWKFIATVKYVKGIFVSLSNMAPLNVRSSEVWDDLMEKRHSRMIFRKIFDSSIKKNKLNPIHI